MFFSQNNEALKKVFHNDNDIFHVSGFLLTQSFSQSRGTYSVCSSKVRLDSHTYNDFIHKITE